MCRVHVLQGGNIVVDGVLASCHSDWFLDDPMQRLAPRFTPLLPVAYQVDILATDCCVSTFAVHMGSLQLLKWHLHVLAACWFLSKGAQCGLCSLRWCSLAWHTL